MHRRRLLVPWLFWLACPDVATARTAGTLDVRVECSRLSTEQRAAIEARARTDLLSRGHTVGQLRLTCGQGAAQAEWVSAPAVPPSTSSLALPDDSHVEDRLLELVAYVLEADAGAVAQDAAPVATFPDSTRPAPPHPTPAHGPAPSPRRTFARSPSGVGPSRSGSVASRSGVRWSSSAGGYVEPWFGAAVLAGPRAGLGVVSDRYWVGVAGVLGAAVSHQSAISPMVIEPTIELAIRPCSALLLATGAGASSVRLTSSSALEPSSATRWRATAFARAGMLFPTGRGGSGLAFAASLQCWDRALEIRANGNSLWSAPACAPRFLVSYESGLPTLPSTRRKR